MAGPVLPSDRLTSTSAISAAWASAIAWLRLLAMPATRWPIASTVSATSSAIRNSSSTMRTRCFFGAIASRRLVASVSIAPSPCWFGWRFMASYRYPGPTLPSERAGCGIVPLCDRYECCKGLIWLMDRYSAFDLLAQHFQLEPFLFHSGKLAAQFFHLGGEPVEHGRVAGE